LSESKKDPGAPAPAHDRIRRPGAGHDTTSGPILGVLVKLAIPIVATNVFQSLYQLIDTFWVGRLGADAVAAVSLSFPILFFMISAGGGLSVPGAVLVAQTFGAKDEAAVDHVAGQTHVVVRATRSRGGALDAPAHVRDALLEVAHRRTTPQRSRRGGTRSRGRPITLARETSMRVTNRPPSPCTE